MKYKVKFSTEFVIEYDTKNKIYYPYGDVPQDKDDEITVRSMANFDIERLSSGDLIDESNGEIETCVKWIEPQNKTEPPVIDILRSNDKADSFLDDDGPIMW